MNQDEIYKIIKNHYGEKAVPYERSEPFAENNLMVVELDGGLKCRAFSPSKPDWSFVVEYYGQSEMYRLDINFETQTSGNVSVMQHTFEVDELLSHKRIGIKEVAKYSFTKDGVSFVSGKNHFFGEVRDTIKTYFQVKQGFIWIEK